MTVELQSKFNWEGKRGPLSALRKHQLQGTKHAILFTKQATLRMRLFADPNCPEAQVKEEEMINVMGRTPYPNTHIELIDPIYSFLCLIPEKKDGKKNP